MKTIPIRTEKMPPDAAAWELCGSPEDVCRAVFADKEIVVWEGAALIETRQGEKTLFCNTQEEYLAAKEGPANLLACAFTTQFRGIPVRVCLDFETRILMLKVKRPVNSQEGRDLRELFQRITGGCDSQARSILRRLAAVRLSIWLIAGSLAFAEGLLGGPNPAKLVFAAAIVAFSACCVFGAARDLRKGGT